MFSLFRKKRENVSKGSDVSLRPMLSTDIGAVFAIEEANYSSRPWTSPWTSEEFTKHLHPKNRGLGFVAECNGRVIGFVVCRVSKREVEILNLSVHPRQQVNGFGKKMVEKLISNPFFKEKARFFLVISEMNLNAQMFFKACKFLAVLPLLGNFYHDGRDAYLMEHRLCHDHVPQILETECAVCSPH